MGADRRPRGARRTGSPLLLALLASLAAGAGCGSSTGFVKMSSEAQLASARDDVARHKWARAVSELTRLSGSMQGAPALAEVEYLLGLAYAGLQDYPTSEKELSTVVREHPDSEWADDAELAIAEGYAAQMRPSQLDQTVTWQALDRTREFLHRFPDSDAAPRGRDLLMKIRTRIAQKSYDNGRLYLQLGDGPAARSYFVDILTDYADTPLAAQAQFGVAESYGKEDRTDEALAAYRAIVDGTADGELKRKSQERIHELEAKKGRS